MGSKGLGKGIEGLIPTDFNINDVAEPGESVKQIEISKVIPNPDQPRKDFDEQSINELANSIKQHSIIQPLVVTPKKDKYRIVAGERRFRAAKVAKLDKVPAIIRNHEELEELEIALVENVQRVDLSPLEQAMSIVKLRDQFSMSHKEIAKKLGKAETTISNIIRLLQLPEEAIKALQKNQISEGHARAILALKTDEKSQKELLNKIITQNLSVREAERLVKEYKNSAPTSKSKAKIPPRVSSKFTNFADSMKLKAKIVPGKKGGSINIKYNDVDELESIIDDLSH